MNECDISLYGILDPARCRERPLADMARAAADGGITLLQYRDKQGDTRSLVDNAASIRAVLEPYRIPLLINDRVDVALAMGADGVHVGQADMHASHARSLLGSEAIIGLTIKSPQDAASAPVGFIDYACIGGVYATLSKNNPTSIGLSGWREAAAPLRRIAPGLPIGAIAGIDETNLAAVLQNGADGAAIISAIFMADDVEAATRRLKKLVEEHTP